MWPGEGVCHLFCLSPFPPGRCSFRGPIGAFKRAVRRALWARNHITLRLVAKKALPEPWLWKGLGIMGRKGTGSRGPVSRGRHGEERAGRAKRGRYSTFNLIRNSYFRNHRFATANIYRENDIYNSKAIVICVEGRGGGGQGCPIPFLFLNSSE